MSRRDESNGDAKDGYSEHRRGADDFSYDEGKNERGSSHPDRSYHDRRGGNRGYPTDSQNRRRRDTPKPSTGNDYYGPRDGERDSGSDRNRERYDRDHYRDDYSRSRTHSRDYSERGRQETGRDRDYRDERRDRDSSRYPPSDRHGRDRDRDYDRDDRRGRGDGTRDRRGRSPNERDNRAPPRRKIREWPPCFDKDGSSFVFHPSSGTFYEEESDFYYDPKTKLYFGVKKSAYFRYDETQDPPFVETRKADPTQGTPNAPVEQHLTLPPTTGKGNESFKSLISINLKTKKMKKPKNLNPGKPADDALKATKAQKEQAAIIDKWTEKQAELKGCEAIPSPDTPVRRTKKGQPVCMVCKRKFPTVEKLRLHEEKSELHRSNLAKLQEAASTKRKEPANADYNDRAKRRRQLHGPLSTTSQGIIQREDDPVDETIEQEGLGETNIGNKLLQKMGWKKGSELGNGTSEDGKPTPSQSIRGDWDRIEALSGANGRSRQG